MKMEFALLQAYDPAHFLKQASVRLGASSGAGAPMMRSEAFELLSANAERDLALALCFGRVVTMPVSFLTDSPLFLETFGRFHEAFEPVRSYVTAQLESLGLPRWVPLGITLHHGFNSLEEIARSYQWAPARFAAFDPLPLEVQAQRVELLCWYLSRGEYQKAAAIVENPGHAEIYERLIRYFDERTAVRPLTKVSVNYVAHFERQLDLLRADGRESARAELERAAGELYRTLDGDEKIRSQFQGRKAAETFRGAWYAHSELFADAWPELAATFDSLNANQVMATTGISNGVFVSPVFNEYGVVSPPTEGVAEADQPSLKVDWKKFWRSFSHPDFLRAVASVSQQLALSTDPGLRASAIRQHAVVVAQGIEGLGLRYEHLHASAERAAIRSSHVRKTLGTAEPIVLEGLDLVSTMILPAPIKASLKAAASIAVQQSWSDISMRVGAWWHDRRLRSMRDMQTAYLRTPDRVTGSALNRDVGEIAGRIARQEATTNIKGFLQAEQGDGLAT
jgi:hypothetical protein